MEQDCCIICSRDGALLKNYVCMSCITLRGDLFSITVKILNNHGMKRLLETIILTLSNSPYELKLKEDLNKALTTYQSRYDEENGKTKN